MDYRRTIGLALQQGEQRQLLLEAGTTVLVLAGRLAMQAPLVWLAENIIARETVLEGEEAWVAERDGWISLEALGAVQAVVLPPDGVPVWRQIGRCLESIFGGTQAAEQAGGKQAKDLAGKGS